jgi:hypothetical protein
MIYISALKHLFFKSNSQRLDSKHFINFENSLFRYQEPLVCRLYSLCKKNIEYISKLIDIFKKAINEVIEHPEDNMRWIEDDFEIEIDHWIAEINPRNSDKLIISVAKHSGMKQLSDPLPKMKKKLKIS